LKVIVVWIGSFPSDMRCSISFFREITIYFDWTSPAIEPDGTAKPILNSTLVEGTTTSFSGLARDAPTDGADVAYVHENCIRKYSLFHLGLFISKAK